MAQAVCILRKLVHASEKQWSRLVIPGGQVPHFTTMQRELDALGSDYQLFVRDSAGKTWRFAVRMVVQRPMILELLSFYAHHDVQPGDTVCLFRNLRTNQLTVEIERAAVTAGGRVNMPAVAAPAVPRPTAMAAAEAAAAHATAVAAAALAARQLPGEKWSHRLKAKNGACGARKRSMEEDSDDEDWAYSPTAAHSKAGSHGLGAVRRALGGLHPAELEDNAASDEDSSDVYTSSQTRRFHALVDAAHRMSQSPP